MWRLSCAGKFKKVGQGVLLLRLMSLLNQEQSRKAETN